MSTLPLLEPSPFDIFPGYSAPPAGWWDQAYDFITQVQVAAGQGVRGLPLRVDFEADFYVHTVMAGFYPGAMGSTVWLQISDALNSYRQKQLFAFTLGYDNFNQNQQNPIPVEFMIPRGGVALLDAVSQGAGAASLFNLTLGGVKRRPVTMGTCPVPGGGAA